MVQEKKKGVTEFVKFITNKENKNRTKGIIKHAIHEEEANLIYRKAKFN